MELLNRESTGMPKSIPSMMGTCTSGINDLRNMLMLECNMVGLRACPQRCTPGPGGSSTRSGHMVIAVRAQKSCCLMENASRQRA
jgi:hypothetical protein